VTDEQEIVGRNGPRHNRVTCGFCLYGSRFGAVGVPIILRRFCLLSKCSDKPWGPHTVSYSVRTEVFFPEVKHPEHEINHSPLSSLRGFYPSPRASYIFITWTGRT
jgi:hypothetical protein